MRVSKRDTVEATPYTDVPIFDSASKIDDNQSVLWMYGFVHEGGLISKIKVGDVRHAGYHPRKNEAWFKLSGSRQVQGL